VTDTVKARRPANRPDGVSSAPRAPAPHPAAPAAGPAAPAWAQASTGAPFGLALPVQRKPVIGRADDAYEREADAVAARVSTGSAATAPLPISRVAPAALAPPVQRKSIGDRTEHDDPPNPGAGGPGIIQRALIQRAADTAKPDDSDSAAAESAVVQRPGEGSKSYDPYSAAPESAANPPVVQRSGDGSKSDGSYGAVQRKGDAGGGAGGSPAMRSAAASAIATRGAGAPLPAPTRATLERGMGVDLGGVRVHTGAGAEHATRQLGARAFTHGSDIWLGRGESPRDTRLMAHEATHVVQQDGVVRRAPAAPAAELARDEDEEERRRLEALAAAGATPAGAGAAASPGATASATTARGASALASGHEDELSAAPAASAPASGGRARTAPPPARRFPASAPRESAPAAQSNAKAPAATPQSAATAISADTVPGPRAPFSLAGSRPSTPPGAPAVPGLPTPPASPATATPSPAMPAAAMTRAAPGSTPAAAKSAGASSTTSAVVAAGSPAASKASAAAGTSAAAGAATSADTAAGSAATATAKAAGAAFGATGASAKSASAGAGAAPESAGASTSTKSAAGMADAAPESAAGAAAAAESSAMAASASAAAEPGAATAGASPGAVSSAAPASSATTTTTTAAGAASTEGATAKATPGAAPGAGAEGAASPDAAAGRAEGAAAAPAEVVIPPAPSVEDDPQVQAVNKRLRKVAKGEAAHGPAAAAADEARAAAAPPENERASRAAAAQTDDMSRASATRPDPNPFLTLLRQRLAEIAPKNLDEMDSFQESGRAGELRGAVSGGVAQQRDAATAELRTGAQTPPDPARVPQETATPLAPVDPGPAPERPGAARAVPPPRPAEQVSLEGSKAEVDGEMAANDIDDAQLQRANDPRFSAVAGARAEVHANAEAAPAQYRDDEAAARAKATRGNAAAEGGALAAMHGTRGAEQQEVRAKQDDAKAKDEAARQAVADRIEEIFGETQKAVDGKLAALDTEVTTLFDEGEAKARAAMESHVETRKEAYKDERYSGVRGRARWAYDLFAGLPDEVSVFYTEARDQYLRDMDAVLVTVADRVEQRLREAKTEVTLGKDRIRVYVEGLDGSLRDTGTKAQAAVQARFKELEGGIDQHREELASSLAQRYTDARQKADEKLAEMRQSDRGLVARFRDALAEVIRILREFRERISAMLAEASDAIGLIIKDPIGFLGNLVDAVRQGVSQFSDRIGEHLREGLFAWLFGALASAGIQMPADFSLPSIFGLVLEVLGVTAANLRRKVAGVIGERNLGMIEQVWGVVQTLISGGLGGLWEQAQEWIGNVGDMIREAVEEWVITRVVRAAITKLVSMFNPAGAIIAAIQGIISTVQFFIERINQIMDLVQAIVQSVSRIARGDIAGAADWIEQAMARAIPVMIGFLASLLGLGGISEKIRGIIQRLQARVDMAIDKVIAKIVGGVAKLFGRGRKDEPREADAEHADVAHTAKDHPAPATAAGTGPGAPTAAAAGAQPPAHPEGPVEATFKMNGADHTLTLPTGPEGEVVMASARPGVLSRRILATIKEMKARRPKPTPQINALTDVMRRVSAIERRVRDSAVTSRTTGQPIHTDVESEHFSVRPQMRDLVTALEGYSRDFGVNDIDVLSQTAEGDTVPLRDHPAMAWIRAHGLEGDFTSRVVNHPDWFTPARIKPIFDQIVRFQHVPRFEAKVQNAIIANRWWSANDSFFFEIAGLRSIADTQEVDVDVGGRNIDVLTASGMLIDHKLEVNVHTDPAGRRVLDDRMMDQIRAMSGAVGGPPVRGIAVTGWEIQHARELTPEARALIAAAGLTAHFRRSSEGGLFS